MWIVAVGGAGMAFSAISAARAVPPIHDISTNPANPLTFSGTVMTARGAKSNPILVPKDATVPFNKERLSPWSGRSLDQIQADAYPEIKTLKLATTSPADAYKKAEAAMKAKGWTVVTQDPAKLRLEASVESFWFGFKDDVVLVVTADGAGSLIDMRSVSRVGVSDLGANAKRIEALLTALKS
jgi:fatty-acyl-CoA synthase